jgi:monoterpene epsilon-lactone hydrolase
VASTQSKLFNLLLRLINKKQFLRRQLASGKSSIFDCPEPTSKVKRICHVQRRQLNGRNVFILTSKNKPKSNKHILYLHGGAYIQCFNRFQWNFLAELVESTGCTITAPDYPLAPTSTYSESFDMVSPLYLQVLETTRVSDFILMGDSSGGGFALALVQKMKIERIAQPGRIILLSPWLDLTLTNPEISSIEPRDPFLERQSLQQAGTLFAGNTDPTHFLLSPINGSLHGLGKISVLAGSNEILVADTRKLNKLAKTGGIILDYHEYEGMFHGWMFLHLPESQKAKQQIKRLIQDPA